MAVTDPIAAGRQAVAARRWDEARELLEDADAGGALDAEGVELLAWSMLWTGQPAEALAVFERAYSSFLEAGDRRRAALIAVELAHEYGSVRWERSTGAGWLARAAELLADEPEGREHGYVALERGLIAFAHNRFDEVLELGVEAERIGRAYGDRGLELRGRQRRGLALVHKGEVEEGKALLDAVDAEAFTVDDPYATLTLYCNAIGTHRDVAAFADAARLTERATAYCEANSVSAFPGLCRVNRAEVKRVEGKFDEAEQEALLACEELRPWSPRFVAAATYELGEVRLRLGDLAKAEEAFETADDLGREPEPGRSLLLLARGRVPAAFASIRRALADDSLGLPERGRLLPAYVEIALAAGDIDAARTGADELSAIASSFESYPTALRAAALQADGAIALAAGDADGAVTPLRRALRLWQESGARYEAARARVLLSLAYRAGGDEDGATQELGRAGSTFDQLGARLDSERIHELLGTHGSARVTMTFVFTDIVDSTKKLEALGDVQWQKVLRQHDTLVERVLGRFGGRVVDHTGDGFFLAFDAAETAAEAAVEIQRGAERELVVELRIGIHTSEATAVGENFLGKGVHTAARIAAQAGPGEILASAETAELLRGASRRDSGAVALKGLAAPVELVAIDWR